MTRVVVISQARMTSTRLPGKVLMEAAGKPLLAWHLERLKRCRRADAVVLATTVNAGDDPVAELAESLGVAVFRGSEPDVLDRFAAAAAMARADVVARVTSDCPLIDPLVIDAAVELLLGQDPPADYAHVDVTRFPRGLDAEVVRRAALDEAQARSTDPFEREHVTPYIYRRPERFRLVSLRPERKGLARARWCVDEAADLDLIRRLLPVLPPDFGWQAVCRALATHPDWVAINRAVVQKGEGASGETKMNAQEFLRALDEMLELDPGTLTGSEVLEDLEGWDSLAVISFIALVDEKTGTVVAGEKLAQARTVADLMALAGVGVAA